MPQIIPQGDIFERIGHATGQGVGEQTERGMLSRGIEDLAKNKDLTGVQQYSKLFGLPGGAQHANQIMPYLESIRAGEASKKLYGEGQGTAEPSKEVNRENANYLLPADEPTLNRRAQEIQSSTGILFDKALKQAQAEDEKRVSSEQAFESRNTLAENEYKKYLKTELEKDNTLKDIIGEMENRYLDKVTDLVQKGKAPRLAGKEVAHELLNFAKARGQLTAEGIKGWYQTTPAASRRAVDQLRDTYKNAGELQQFKQDLVTKLGMNEPFAESIAFPPSENKEVVSAIKSLRGEMKKNRPMISAKEGKISIEKPKNEEAVYDRISKAIGDNDSINAIALSLYENGGDPEKFRAKVQKDYKNGKRLNENQVRELGESGIRYSPSLKDLWYTTILGGHKGGI